MPVLTMALPRAGTTASSELARSYPAAPAEPRFGSTACSSTRFTSRTGAAAGAGVEPAFAGGIAPTPCMAAAVGMGRCSLARLDAMDAAVLPARRIALVVKPSGFGFVGRSGV